MTTHMEVEVVLLAVAVSSMAAGAIPGAWLGARGQERSRGHLILAAVVGLLAIAAVAFYTIAGAPEELFSRVVMLPLSLLIAIAAVGVIVGIPMYASYLFAHRAASYLLGKVRTRNSVED